MMLLIWLNKHRPFSSPTALSLRFPMDWAMSRPWPRHWVLNGSSPPAPRTGRSSKRAGPAGPVLDPSLATTPLGPSLAQVGKVVNLLNDAQLNAVVESDPTALIWNKVMLNVAINPLAALGGLKNGELLEPDLFASCMMVYREASTVAIMERADVPDEREFEQRLRTVLEQTRENTCSMLQDVKAGRQTEIEALNQAVVERAEHHGLAAPINQMLASLVRACHP